MSRVLVCVCPAFLVASLLVACAGPALTGPDVRLVSATERSRAAIDIVNLDRADLSRLREAALTHEQWTAVLRVSVAEDQPAMLGDYAVIGRSLRFTPMFPLDPGRGYHVEFRAAAIPGAEVGDARRVTAVVSLPGLEAEPSTVVSHVFPSTGIVPDNQLRLYIHFSAPMGLKGGLDFVSLLDDRGVRVEDPFLPLDAEFWNDDHTRYTVFFDPGRQKRGILPNQQMGRSLEAGKTYTLVVNRDWRDGNGLPLKDDYRREFIVGPSDEAPLDPRTWQVAPPLAGTRDALVVTFPESLDHGLLLRALGVAGQAGGFLGGDVRVDERETRWSFTPRQPWQAGRHDLIALSMLEDLAGNRIGRAFEVDNFDHTDESAEPERTAIPFTVPASAASRN